VAAWSAIGGGSIVHRLGASSTGGGSSRDYTHSQTHTVLMEIFLINLALILSLQSSLC